MMAVKSEPVDMDSEPPALFTKCANGSPGSRSSAHDDFSSQPLNLTSHPVNFLTEQGRPDMVVDPLHNDVMFLPPRPPPHDDGGTGEDEGGEGCGGGGGGGGGRGGQRVSARREVTEYATYTISHHEAELNSKLLPKKYRCRFCVYKTSYKSDLNRHLRKHGIAPQHCPLCNMPFKTTGNLENHMRQTHGDMAAGILPPSPSASSAALPGLCLDTGGFLGPAAAAALAMGGAAALSPVVGGVVVPCVGIPPSPSSSSPSDLVQFEPSRGRGRHPHHLSRRLDSQLQHEFPALSQAVLSPAQLSCHVCSFVCSDSEVLARHLLTHPAEEEVSRALASRNKPREGSSSPDPLSEATARRSPPTPASITRLACNYCGAILSSIDELQLHRLSCVDPAEVLQRADGEDLRRRNRKDSQRPDTNKDDAEDVSGPCKDNYRDTQTKNAEGNRGPAERTLHGLPRQETMEKLRRTLTNQSVTVGALSNCRSAPSQNHAPYQQQTSMILPHLPTTENTDSGDVVRKTCGRDASRDGHTSDVVRIVIDSDDSPESVVICEDDTHQHRDADNQQHSDNRVPDRLKSNPETPVIQPTRESVPWCDEDSECERTAGKVTEHAGEHRRTCIPAYKDTAASNKLESRAVLPAHADNPPPQKRARKSSLCNISSSPIDLSSCQRWRETSDQVLQLLRPDNVSVKDEPASPDASTDTEAFQSHGGCAYVMDGCKDRSSPAERAGDRHVRGVDTQRCASCGKTLMGKDQLLRHMYQVHGLKSRSTDPSSSRKIKAVSHGDPGNLGNAGRNTRVSSLGHHSPGRTTSRIETAMREGGSRSPRTRPLTSAVVSPVAQATSTNLTARRHTTESHSFSRSSRPGGAVDTKVTSHPPMSGRYAKLVSDFEEFSRQPYACSLCFFRTARLGELQTHVHNHLTGGNADPVPDTAKLEAVTAFSVERGTSPGVGSDSPGVRNPSPDRRSSSSSSVRSNSPGAAVDCPAVLMTSSDFNGSSSGVRCSSPCVRLDSSGVGDNSSGASSNSPGARCDSSVGQCNSPGPESYSPDVRIASPDIRDTSPGFRSTPLNVQSTSGGAASSAGWQSPGCVEVPHGNAPAAASLLSVEIVVASPHVRPRSASPSSPDPHASKCVDVVGAPAPTELGSSKLTAFPVEMNSVSSASSATHRPLVAPGTPEEADSDVSSVAGNGRECSNTQSVAGSGVKAHLPALPPIQADCANELNIVALSSSSGEGGDDPEIQTENVPSSEFATLGMSSHLSPVVVEGATTLSKDESCALDLTSSASPEKTDALGNRSATTDDDIIATLSNDTDDDINNNVRRGDAVQTETPASTGADDDGRQTSDIHQSSSPSPGDTMESLFSVAKLIPDQESSSRCESQDSQKTSLDHFAENRSLPMAEKHSVKNTHDPDFHSDAAIGEIRSPLPGLITSSEQPSNAVYTATSSSEMVHSLPIPSPRKPARNSCTRKIARSRTISRCPIHRVNRRKGKRAHLQWKQKLLLKPSADLLSRDWSKSNGLGCRNTKNRCSHCGKSFSLRQLLVRHMRCIH